MNATYDLAWPNRLLPRYRVLGDTQSEGGLEGLCREVVERMGQFHKSFMDKYR